MSRPYPQESYVDTVIDKDSFAGQLRLLYGNKVLKTQLEQLKAQGSYDAFKMGWNKTYETRRLKGGMTRSDGVPPSLFWESDVGKWIEAACYFLNSADSKNIEHEQEYVKSIDELVDMIAASPDPDGYLGLYFRVVDPGGRFKNLRDMHEMYNCGHLLEAALAHHKWSGSSKFLDPVCNWVDLFRKTFGPEHSQKHGYPGHPELELASLRTGSVLNRSELSKFGKYLLEARGQPLDDQEGDSYFVYEAKQRDDYVTAQTMYNILDQSYNMSHIPLHDQDAILGHSVRAFYLLTACADIGGAYLEDAKRLWADCVENKMYMTGGIGTEPQIEGFSETKHWLPQSTEEGGCYAETCAVIACMMCSERILSHELNGKYRDVLELCFYNAVLGGGSLNGKQFAYANKHATCGDETAIRKDWFEVCCCPPNLSRTMGMLGGYTWSTKIDDSKKSIQVDVYLFNSATRTIELPGGEKATIEMSTKMPWYGQINLKAKAPEGWSWILNVPTPDYAENIETSQKASGSLPGYSSFELSSSSELSVSFNLPVQLLSPHPSTSQDTLTVKRGPIVYTAESYDNTKFDDAYPHFAGVGIKSDSTFEEKEDVIEGIPVIMLRCKSPAYVLEEMSSERPYEVVKAGEQVRNWKKLEEFVTFVPWFARANRGGAGRLRTAFRRVPS